MGDHAWKVREGIQNGYGTELKCLPFALPESDGGHARRNASADAGHAVLHDQALGGINRESIGSAQENFGVWLPVPNLVGAEDEIVWKEGAQTRHTQAQLDLRAWSAGRDGEEMLQSGEPQRS